MRSSGRTTLKEIAHRAETSTMAVSVVLNGARSNTRVSEDTRRRIQQIAAELNYSPNAMAQGLRRRRTETLGVLFSWAGARTVHDLFSMAVLDGIVDGAANAGYHILLYTRPWRDASASSPVFSDGRADGIVVVAPLEDSDVVPSLAALGLPVAVLSSVTDVAGVPSVAINNGLGVSLALDHLRALGHARIAFAGLGRDRLSMRERHDAYLAWMARQGLPAPHDCVLAGLRPGEGPENAARLECLLRLPDRPTAVLAVTDDLAVQALEVARALGIAVPDQLSVVGFDDVPAASHSIPKLTTIRQPLFEMGQRAVRLLIGLIEGRGEAGGSTAHVIAPKLIVRDSTASPPWPAAS